MASLAVIIFALVFIGLLIKAVKGRRLTEDPSFIGKLGENRVASILHSLPKEYLAIKNIIVPSGKA